MSLKFSQATAAGTLTGSELVLVSQLSTTVTMTATTLSALASDNSYNDSAAQFVAEGFAVGDTVKVSGFTGNAANNINSGTITALTTAKMTIGGTDGDVIVDDAAGESVTITKWDTRRATSQEVANLGGGGGAGLSGLTFTSDTGSTADSDPGNGLFKWNNATQASATVLYFDNQTLDAISLTTFYGALPATGYLYLQQSDDSTKWQMWKWTGVTSASGYYKFTVTLQASGGSIADDKTVYCDFKPDANSGSGSGVVVQVKNTQTGAVATGTTTIPLDDTIPQNTEGNEYMTLAITPTSATNRLKIDVVWCGASSALAAQFVTAALFQDSTANALACGLETGHFTDDNVTISFSHNMVAGTTSATTFKVRAGANGAGTTTFNGRASARLFGGVYASSITITEYTP